MFTRLQRARNAQLQPDEEPVEKKSRRERKLEKVREYDPLPEPKSIFDIMNEEADDIGINEIPGGEGLEIPVKLKVWRRDEGIRDACGGSVRFEITAGVDPKSATVDDVWIVCHDGSRPAVADGAGESDQNVEDEQPAEAPTEPEENLDGADAPSA